MDKGKFMKNYELLTLADDAYRLPKAELPNFNYKKASEIGWEYVGSSDDLGLSKEGYFGVAFKKGEEVVVAHRGTDGITDVDDDISIWFNKIPDQYEYALKFTEINTYEHEVR